LTIAPGAAAPSRTHAGAAYAYVIEGEVESRTGANPTETMRAGIFFHDTSGGPARTLRNPSATAAAKVLILQNSPTLPAGVKPLLQATLTDLKDLDVTFVEGASAPGSTGPKPHIHPGPTFAYLWKGEVKSQIDPDEPETFRAGDVFFESPAHVHRSYVNMSKTDPAELILFTVAKRGQTSAQAPAPAK
jgi:quercetin dioxygenase-like cupin family protein